MDNLFNTLLVVEDPDPLTDEQLQAVLKSFDDYKLLIVDYLKDYYDNANIKQYITFIKMPYDDIYLVKADLSNIRFIETVHLPFMSCDLGLWNYLLEHPDNPLFKLFSLFEMYSRNILNILSVKGVALNLAISNTFMEDNKILDILNLHEYIGLYYNFSDFIKQEGSKAYEFK